MSIRRTLTTGVALATLLLLVAGPAGAGTSDTTTRGTAATTSVPLHVEALDVPVDLGRTLLMATTDSDTTTLAPWSTVQLTLADIAGTPFGQMDVSSDGTTTSEGAVVDESTAVGAVGATVGDVLALADDSAHTATAALTTLTTDATVLNALGLEATITDVTSTVDDGGAAATHSLAVAGIDLDLAHILGSVLDELPLEDLLALADVLDVDVPVNLDPVGDVITATEELIAAVTAAVDAADAVETAVDALIAADGGTLADLEGLITAVQDIDLLSATLLADLQAILDNEAFPADCEVDLGALVLDQDLLDSIEACLDNAVDDHLGTLADELTALETAVANYIDAVAAVALAAGDAEADAGDLTVSDILDDIAALVAGLLDADLLALGGIEVSQQVRAVGGQLDASSATHTCQVTGLRALGGDPIELTNCDGGADPLTAAITLITTTLGQVLDTVGGVDAGDGVELELFNTAESSVTEDADGWVRATSVMEVLALTVPDITITPCDIADGLVCGLGLDIDGTLETVLGTLEDLLAAAETTAEDAITTGGLEDLLEALGAEELITDVTDVDVEAVLITVGNAVEALTEALNSLIDELGDLGSASGATVPGAKIVVDPALEAEHQVVAAGADPGPADPAPDPGDDPTLPNTGGGAALLAILALGAGAWLWRRRELE